MGSLGSKIGLALFLCRLFLSATAGGAEPIPVFVSILPQKTFVEKIGGDFVDVSVMVLPGANPATYEPKPSQMAALATARMFYAIGVPFERVWLGKMASINPNMRIVHTDRGIEKIPMAPPFLEVGDLKKRVMERAENHDHGLKDPHVWLSPPLVMLQARNMLMPLLELDPANRDVYEVNYREFMMEILALDAEIRELFIKAGQKAAFMVFHPAWGYFAEAYGLKQIPVEIEGKEPKPAQIRRLIDYGREKGVKAIFVQPQFSTKSAKIIAEAIGARVLFANPLDPEWSRNLREQAREFEEALR